MSVWSDMGLTGGRMNGVNPCVFLNNAYSFFYDLRKNIWPDDSSRWIPQWDFSLRRKAGEREPRNWIDWEFLGGYLSFNRYQGTYSPFFVPVRKVYWDTLFSRDDIFNETEESLLGETIVPCPYSATIMRTAIMDPAWPTQRYKIIQQMRYLTVPLEIRVKIYDIYSGGQIYWTDWYSESFWQRGYSDTDEFKWCGKDHGGRYLQLEAKFPEYWRKGDTVCKISYEGGWYYPEVTLPPPPINGRGWYDGRDYLTEEYTGQYSERGVVRLYGAVDLSTHPDYAEYFDVNTG